MPASLHTQDRWRNGPEGKEYKGPCWPTDELLVACGGEVADLPRDKQRDQMQIVCKDVRFGDRVFRAGDLIANMERERGEKSARLSVFNGGRSSKS